MIISTHAQRTPEWFQDRLGKITGSRAKDVIATIKNGEAASRRDYRVQLVLERLTGKPKEAGFLNEAMQRGIDKEPEARLAYQAITGDMVDEVGFITHASLMIGCSVDGLIEDPVAGLGFLEIKCPTSATQLGYKLGPEVVPAEHMPQLLHNFLVIPEAQWCAFFSWDDRCPGKLARFLVTLSRANVEQQIMDYQDKLLQFLDEVAAMERQCARLVL